MAGVAVDDGCEVANCSGGLSHVIGVGYARKDCVMEALAEFGKKTGAVLGGECSVVCDILQHV